MAVEIANYIATHDAFVRISPMIKHMCVSREAGFCAANDFAIAILQTIIALMIDCQRSKIQELYGSLCTTSSWWKMFTVARSFRNLQENFCSCVIYTTPYSTPY